MSSKGHTVIRCYSRTIFVRWISIMNALSRSMSNLPVPDRYNASPRLGIIMLSGLQCAETRCNPGGSRLSIWIPLDIFISSIGRPCLSIRRKGDIRTVINRLCRLCRKHREKQYRQDHAERCKVFSLYLHCTSLLFSFRQKKARTFLFGLFIDFLFF